MSGATEVAASTGERTAPTRTLTKVVRPGSLIGLTAALFGPGLAIGPSPDAAVFVLAGTRVRDGFMPYRDVWDHKPPGVYLVNALGQVTLPWLGPWAVSWLLTVVAGALAILLMDDLLRRRLSPAASWFWSLAGCVGVGSYIAALGGGLTESFALLPLVGAVWVVDSLPPTRRAAAFVGVLLGCACVLSLQSVPAAAVVAMAAAWRGDVRSSVGLAVTVVAGAAVVVLAIAAWLAVGGSASDAIDELLTYNAAYGRLGNDLASSGPLTALLYCGLAIPVGAAVWRLLGGQSPSARLEWLCLAWCACYVAWIVYQGRFFTHYVILIVPPLILLAGGGMQELWARVRLQRGRLRGGAIALAAAAACAFLVSGTLLAGLSALKEDQAGAATRVMNRADDWIRANTSAQATTFVWGDEAALYLSDGLAPYDRYVYQFPLVTPGYWSAERTSQLLGQWRESPPTIVVEAPGTVAMFRLASPSRDARTLDTLDPLREFVRANYRLKAAFGDDTDFADVYVLELPG